MEVSKAVLDAVENAATDKRITCPECWKIVEELKVAPAEVGQAANQLEIKIKSCALGCF